MKKLPTWLKVAAALLLFAILFGGVQFLLYLDKAQSSPRFGLD